MVVGKEAGRGGFVGVRQRVGQLERLAVAVDKDHSQVR